MGKDKAFGRTGRGAANRDAGAFVAIPLSVLESAAFISLGYPAKALLLELAKQYHGDDNGRLLLERKKLAARGWTSPEVIQRARDELIAKGFVHETVKGQRPNKAGWYAITWHALSKNLRFDKGADLTFPRSAYRIWEASKPQNACTAGEQARPPIGTAPVQAEPPPCTSAVPIRPRNHLLPCTPAVHPLDMPSTPLRFVGHAPTVYLVSSTPEKTARAPKVEEQQRRIVAAMSVRRLRERVETELRA